MPFLADCSLSLINRTGAHFVARQIVEGLPRHFPAVRHWRLLRRDAPPGLARKICGRLMLREIAMLGARPLLPWPRPDAAMPTLFMDPLYVLRAPLGARDIVLCHDIGPVSHPALYDPATVRMYRAAYAKIRDAAPRMVFVSAASRAAFTALFGSAYPALDVVPLFVRGGSADGPQAPVAGVKAPFLLTVGAFERRKNHPRAIAAFHASGLAREGVSYVLCGARGLDWDAVYEAAAQGPGVIALPYVDESQLRWLYRNAAAFILPSLLEGFGMPALEAARYGLLPVVSGGGALEEAVGGLGIAVDPLSVPSIAEGMRAALALSTRDRAEKSAKLADHARAASRERFLQGWERLLAKS